VTSSTIVIILIVIAVLVLGLIAFLIIRRQR
jgi:preprotein translocase subunit YajC